MANIKSVIDECLTIAEAFTSINSQTYNELGAINFEDNNKTFPHFLFDKRSINVAVDSYTNNSLPNKSKLTADIYFHNTYTELEKEAIDLQTKEAALITIANQFIAELKSRNKSSNTNFILEVATYKPLDETHNEQLIQIAYTLEFTMFADDCTLGIFNY